MTEFFRSVDTILMGRKTFDIAMTQTGNSQPATKKTKRKSKSGWGMKSFVFSRTLNPALYDDVTVVSENAGEFVRSLKNQAGKDIWLMGGGELAGSLLSEDAVDEISLNIHPILLGRGIPLVQNLAKQLNLELQSSKAHKNGCVQVEYRVKY